MQVLVVGIDGVRLDTLRAASTPALDSVAAGGFLAPVRVDDEGPTISGPSWSTIATGWGRPATECGTTRSPGTAWARTRTS